MVNKICNVKEFVVIVICVLFVGIIYQYYAVRISDDSVQQRRLRVSSRLVTTEIGDLTLKINSTASVTKVSLSADSAPVRSFVFTKVSKTGSSTLYGCFSRMIKKYKLNVMVMTKGVHLDTSKPMDSTPGWSIGPRKNKPADILLNHARVNFTLFNKYINPEAKYVVSVREQISWFESAVNFYDTTTRNMTTDEVAMTDSALYAKRGRLYFGYISGIKTVFHLCQLQWFGFDYNLRSDLGAMEKFVDDIVTRYEVILLDQFDAGLVLLRRKFHWDYLDIFYLLEKRKSGKPLTKLSPQHYNKILSKDFNYGDQLLYKKFNESWWSNPEPYQEEFWKEVEQFKVMNNNVQKSCREIVHGKAHKILIPANNWTEAINLELEFCRQLMKGRYAHVLESARYAIGSKYSPL